MIFKWFENSLDNIKIHNYILLSYFEVKKISIRFDIQQIVNFQYEIQHNLRSLIFMIFEWFENSLDNIKIHNYIYMSYIEVKKYRSGLIFSRL